MFPKVHPPIITDITENVDFVDKLDWETLHTLFPFLKYRNHSMQHSKGFDKSKNKEPIKFSLT